MSNWFKIHRDIFDSDIWHDVTTFRLFMLLIGKATHKDGIKIAGVELKRGQYLRSYRKLAEDLSYAEGRGTKQYSLRTIKRCIDKLIKDERLSKEETEQGTLFTVTNYAKYQGFNDSEKTSVNASRNEGETFGKRSVNNNKNAKNAKKDISSNSSPYFSEVIDFYQNNLQRGLTESPFNLELLSQFYEEYGHDLLMAAMKIAAKAEAKGIKFVEGVLNNWREAGVKTIEDARKHEINFRSRQKRHENYKVVKIPNYQMNEGDDGNAKSNVEDTETGGHVRLFR